MELKMFSIILFFIITVKCIESKKETRSYVIVRDKLRNEHNLYGYSIFDSTEKQRLYRLKTTYSDVDILMLIDYPAKNAVGNMEGGLLEGKFNITFSVYDQRLSQWTNGSMDESVHFLLKKYTIKWNSKEFVMKNRASSKTTKIYNTWKNQLVAKFVKRTKWVHNQNRKYDLTIYIDELPDAVCFFAISVIDHRLFHAH